MPGGVVRVVPGDDPVNTALAEFYEVPWNDPDVPVQGYSPRGMDVDSDGIVWTVLSSGHLASFDRRKCDGPLNGPTATGKHCGEGWILYPFPGPNYKGATDSGSADSAYYNFTDRFNLLGVGENIPPRNRQPVRKRARAGRRRVPHLPRAVPVGELLREGAGRANRRSQLGLEGPRDLDDLRKPNPIPRGRRQGTRGPGLQVSGSAGPAGALVGFGIALAGFHGVVGGGCLFREVFLAPAQMTN